MCLTNATVLRMGVLRSANRSRTRRPRLVTELTTIWMAMLTRATRLAIHARRGTAAARELWPALDGTGTTCVLDSAFALGDELCDGFDNDCNGLADEPWAAELGTSGVAGKGPCTTLGEVVCTADGTGTECVAVLPVSVAEELCNGVDDDCDGEIDEDFPGVGEPCSVAPAGAAPGACEVYGTIQCVGVHTATCATPTPAALEPEFCDGLDNDCDGQIDEGSLPGEGEVCGSYTGACEHGVLECVGGNLLCIGGTSPVEEVCNGLDDDCDGEADEGVPACGDTGATCQSDLECLTGVCILNRCT